ncbi:MAG: cytochrome c3 family protein [Candidatus Polarisedimenticolaceae bacterium]|nr:cytochrome c3 family protein [Candidatus Polarisedimenticolaceae bacterium]
MNKSIFTVAVTAAILGLSFQASASITNTKHNLSSIGQPITGVNGANRIYSTDNPEICIYCHTPHNAIKNDVIPLWNHDLSTVASYGVYTSPTFGDGSQTGDQGLSIADLGGVTAATAVTSNLCLSCHDGTIAINAVNNPSNGNPIITMTGGDAVGAGRGLGADWSTNLFSDGTLENDHPVNFSYIEAQSMDGADNGGLREASSLTNVKLFAGYIQCPSCHDPHNDTDGEQPFLRMSMDGSALCLMCHQK